MSRSRWIKRALAGVVAFSTAAGCKQQLINSPADYSEAIKLAPRGALETNPHGPILPPTVDKMDTPPTVSDFVRPPRYMTLRECVALSLEQGNVGGQNPNNFGLKNEIIDSFGGRNVGGTDAIRAFAIDPAIAAAEVERSLSRFDVRWVSSMQWQKLDQPVAAQFLSFQQSRDAASLSTTLAKGLPTGGMVGITASTDYSKFATQSTQQTNGLISPNYTPRVQVAIEQPLLRLFGVEVNQISNIGPFAEGSQILPGIRPAGGGGTEGILITRLRLDQNRANFDQQVNYMLANVEAAYWNLFAAYYNLYAQEEGLRQAFEGYRFIKIRVDVGSDPWQRLDQIQAQFHRFQGQVIQARGQVLESERQLRGLLGLRSDDGTRIVPIDDPNLAPYIPDFHEAANDTVALRPELMLARQDVKFRQLDLMLQKNLRRPGLTGFGTYDVAGLGTRLGGGSVGDALITGNGTTIEPGNAFTSLADNRFNSWTIGLRLDMPLGQRDANALVRQAQLNLTRSYVQLRDSELKFIEFLAFQYRRVIQTHVAIAPAQAERIALQKFVWRIREKIRIGTYTTDEFLNYLTVQQQLAAAISNETSAIAQYNIALASFEFAKGTIQQYNNVSVGEGALPPWVCKRAKDHIRERTEAAFKIREQPLTPGGPAVAEQTVGPAGGVNSVLRLPPFAQPQEKVPDMLPPMLPEKGGNSMVPGVMPSPNGLGGAGRPLPTFGTHMPSAPVSTDGTFTPNSRGPLPDGARPYTGNPLPPLPNEAGGANEYFTPNGTVNIPPPLTKGTTPGAIGTVSPPPLPIGIAPGGTNAAPGEYFSPNGRVPNPTLPKRPGDPIWAPSDPPEVTPIPVPPVTSVPPVPPVPPVGIPPSLPPLPGGGK